MVDASPDISIRVAAGSDVVPIVAVLTACQQQLLARGIQQWPATFPDLAAVAQEVADGHTHVLVCQSCVVATVTLSPQMPKLAQHVRWLTNNRLSQNSLVSPA